MYNNVGGHLLVEDEREIEVINGWVYRHINP